MGFPRISGHLGEDIDLDISFFRNGVLADPYAIRVIEIYHSAVREDNIVAEIAFPPPWDSSYPSPAVNPSVGNYVVSWAVPSSGLTVPDVFFDVWKFLPSDPGSAGIDDESLWQQKCCRFWLYPDSWFADCGLETIRLGFESLDLKLHKPEVRTIEVGLMPLPLYDFDFNLIMPIIPQLVATISIFTENCEQLVDEAPMKIGLRQGSYRSNPFVLQYKLDTSTFLKGTYKYRCTVRLPNGETRVSPDFSLSIG